MWQDFYTYPCGDFTQTRQKPIAGKRYTTHTSILLFASFCCIVCYSVMGLWLIFGCT